jgi:hypothetical protein
LIFEIVTKLFQSACPNDCYYEAEKKIEPVVPTKESACGWEIALLFSAA